MARVGALGLATVHNYVLGFQGGFKSVVRSGGFSKKSHVRFGTLSHKYIERDAFSGIEGLR